MDTSAIAEHMSVIGSDGIHVGVVDRVEGDMIRLTRSDPIAGDEHHYIPLNWVDVVVDVVRLRLRGQQAIQEWRTEEEQRAAEQQRRRDDAFAANRERSTEGEVF